MNIYNPYATELYHHGVKGQKWGVRNYQTNDGSWTEEGLERRRSGYTKLTGKEMIKNTAHDFVEGIDSLSPALRVAGKTMLAGTLTEIGGIAAASLFLGASAPLGLAGYGVASTVLKGLGGGVAVGTVVATGKKKVDTLINAIEDEKKRAVREKPEQDAYNEQRTRRAREATYASIRQKYGKESADKYADSFKNRHVKI